MVDSLNDLVILNSKPIEAALAVINNNLCRGVVVVDDRYACLGVLTDGDIRRHLMTGGCTTDLVGAVVTKANLTFRENWQQVAALSAFSAGYMLVPVLSGDGEDRLIDVVTKDTLAKVQRSLSFGRAPCRVGFGGGGTDVSSYFLDVADGFTVNAAIEKYALASLQRSEKLYRYQSVDLGIDISSESFDEFKQNLKFSAPLIWAVIKVLSPNLDPFHLITSSDVPIGSGLGGSAAITVASLVAFSEYQNIPWHHQDILAASYDVERNVLQIEGGWQDQYAAVYGGFNAISLDTDGIGLVNFNLSRDVFLTLESSLFLVSTNVFGRFSGDSHSREEIAIKQKNKSRANLYEMGRKIFTDLSKARLHYLAEYFNESWREKLRLAPTGVNQELDQIHRDLLAHGVSGARLIGAGEGGFFLCLSNPMETPLLIEKLDGAGYDCEKVKFSCDGAVGWSVEEFI